jgi:hypothetical protein
LFKKKRFAMGLSAFSLQGAGKIGKDRYRQLCSEKARKGILEPIGSHLRKRLHEHVDLGFAEHELLA